MTPAGIGPSGTVDEGRRAKLPQANIAVANRTSHGTIRAKAAAGVASSRRPPTAPPIRLIANRALNREPLRAADQGAARQPCCHLAGEQRHRGGDIRGTSIEPGQDERRQGDKRSASGKRILRACPKPGEKEQEHRRTMRDGRTGEKARRWDPLQSWGLAEKAARIGGVGLQTLRDWAWPWRKG